MTWPPRTLLRIEHGTGQVVLWTTGPAHLDLVLARLKERYNVSVEKVAVRVPMKETPSPRPTPRAARQAVRRARPVRGRPPDDGAATARHRQRSSTETVVGGAVPRQFIQSVEKGARAISTRTCSRGVAGRRRERFYAERQSAFSRLQ